MNNFDRLPLVLYQIILIFLLSLGTGCGSVDSSTVHIAVASSLTDVINTVRKRLQHQDYPEATISTSGSQTVARQISQGQEVDIVALASIRWMDYLEKKNLLEPTTRRPFLANRLVLIGYSGSSLSLDSPRDLKNYEGSLALGDPEAVPAGVYARKTLKNCGLWEDLSDQVIPFPHVRGTLGAVQSGNAELGIVYRTDALQFRGVTVLHEFSSESTPPIRYSIALTRSPDSNARQWFEGLLSEENKNIYEQFGFHWISP